jgi:putative FmdB family regulatory protein
MPTYDYRCPQCGAEDERFVKVSIRKEQDCGECGTRLEQIIKKAPAPHWTSLAMGAGASPEAIKKFHSMRRDQRAKEEKSKREHGDYGKAPGS